MAPLLLLVAALAGGGCGTGTGEAEGPPDPLPEGEAARALELGAPAADALAQGLVGELTRVISEEGAERALAFCSEEAWALTRTIQDDHDDRLELKRATLRWRNSANAPDAWEERVLRYLETLEVRDPEAVPTELTARGPDGALRYYRVLRTAPMCLNCHGDVASLDRGVRQAIRALYPNDRATGYQRDDLRGVIRVEIPADAVPP
jgi:hypothetical protein